MNTLNTSDAQTHRNKRRLLNLVFTEKSLRSAEEFIINHVDRWNEILKGDNVKPGEWSAPFNIAEWADYLAFDIMGDLSFGVQFNTKEAKENRFRKVPHTIHEYLKFNYPVGKSLYFAISAQQGMLMMLTLLRSQSRPFCHSFSGRSQGD